MSEMSFAMFCLTVITLAAIARGKDEIAEKALSTLGNVTKGLISIVEKIAERFHDGGGPNNTPKR